MLSPGANVIKNTLVIYHSTCFFLELKYGSIGNCFVWANVIIQYYSNLQSSRGNYRGNFALSRELHYHYGMAVNYCGKTFYNIDPPPSGARNWQLTFPN